MSSITTWGWGSCGLTISTAGWGDRPCAEFVPEIDAEHIVDTSIRDCIPVRTEFGRDAGIRARPDPVPNRSDIC
jgi:hypothetical protein